MCGGSSTTSPQVLLASLTTLGVGGPARKLVRPRDEQGLLRAVQDADSQGEPLLIVGGGSNLLISDDGFDGTVVHLSGEKVPIEILAESKGAVEIRVAAGYPWDDLVAHTVERGWAGIEALSGIPGLAGATPVQNVGAYGSEISQVLLSVRAWDRQEALPVTL